MKQHAFTQGSPEWHAHRATHFNASDAPAMLGCSPYMTRTELLVRMKTGLAPDVDAATQRRFDEGHRVEALARPLAEELIGEDLYPVTGSQGELSASFDGLTMDAFTAFEHKSLNDELRSMPIYGTDGDGLRANDLPKHFRVQMEQQLLVSGAERVLFMASKWDDDMLVEERHGWYSPDPALRAEIVGGWQQFAADLATFESPAAPAPKLVAEAVESLPAPVVQVTGQLALKDNFKVFEERLRDFLEHRLIREPKTDADFVNLDAQIKQMKMAREALGSAEAQMLAQVQPIDQAKKTKDMLDKLLQQNLSMAEGLLKNEKERRRGEIVDGGAAALVDHVAALNKRLGKAYMPAIPADFAGCVKGLKSIASMEDKVATELARAKIAANEVADRIDVNLQMLREVAGQHTFLFADTSSVVLKAPEDSRALAENRVSAHKAAEEKRVAAEREQIRIEEEAKAREKLECEQREAAAAAAPAPTLAPAPIAPPAPAPQAQNVVPLGTRLPKPAEPVATLRLGQINEALAPIAITAEGLATLGFHPVSIEKAAKNYRADDMGLICDALVAHLRTVQQRQQQAA